MIDVHPPQHGSITRRDFFIHLFTVVLGILIAIGLEQTVELVHHRNQRRDLEDRLQQEARINHNSALVNVAIDDKIIAWLLQLQQGVDTVRQTGGKTTFVYPPRPDGALDTSRRIASYRLLAAEAWSTAKDSSLVELLPHDVAEIHARVYMQADQVEASRERVRQIGMQQGAFETRFSHGAYPPQVDIARLTPAQLDEYEAILADELESVRLNQVRLRTFAIENDYVLAGGLTDDGLRQAIQGSNGAQ